MSPRWAALFRGRLKMEVDEAMPMIEEKANEHDRHSGDGGSGEVADVQSGHPRVSADDRGESQ